MTTNRCFALIACATLFGGCTYLRDAWDKATGREVASADSRQQAAPAPKRPPPQREAPVPALPPPPTWSTALPGGARLRFGAGSAFPQVNPQAELIIANALAQDGWAREFGRMPSIYFVEVDNRQGRTDVNWGGRDRVVLAAEGRTYEQDAGFVHRATLKPYGGFEQTVLPGTTGFVPVAFVDPVPLRSISVLRIQSGSVSIPLACDTKPPSSGDANAAAPAR
jgi:hypothetical protein